MLGDMLVLGQHPAKAIKALAVIAAHLHPTYDGLDGAPAGGSKDTCLFTSLAVRDFLVGIGYADATVRTCAVVVRGCRDGTEVWSVGIGVPDERHLPDKFNGHAVTLVPSIGLMIDSTLYQAQRPKFEGALPGMMALPYDDKIAGSHIGSLKGFSGVEYRDEVSGLDMVAYWGDRPEIKWRRQLDVTRAEQRNRRARIAKALIAEFGSFIEA